MARFLFVGDVVGKPGRRALSRLLPELIDRRRVDAVIVNVENAAGGRGVTPGVLEELAALPIDCMTTGNHAWAKREGVPLFDRMPILLRPANYPEDNPGVGVFVGELPAGTPYAVINLEGQAFMKPLPSPFTAADRLLADLDPAIRLVLVDFHAEATSEKQAMAYHLDGRVSAVLGTHTHVPTADARILEGGTALITDVGMTGPYDSVIGVRADRALKRFLLNVPSGFEVAKRDVRLAAVLVDADETTGRATKIEPLLISLD
ncbi:MAG: TIGR00282 family metallophosphoesterase [Acidobacteria bacterium]|nr:TIGR00282 family metallophosphoesterase [Acidobacteriota bacterium]